MVIPNKVFEGGFNDVTAVLQAYSLLWGGNHDIDLNLAQYIVRINRSLQAKLWFPIAEHMLLKELLFSVSPPNKLV